MNQFLLRIKGVLTLLGTMILVACQEADPKIINDPIVQDTIPVSMTQEHIPWASLADSPWPMYSHDPQGTRRSRLNGPISGQYSWGLQLDGVQSTVGVTPVSIGADSTLYFGSSYENPEGKGQSWVYYALTPNAEIKWTFRDTLDFDQWTYGAPIITADNKIIFSTPTSNSYANIYALDADGQVVWKYKHNHASYLIEHMNIGLDGTIYFIDNNGNLGALDANGIESWTKYSDNTFKAGRLASLAIAPDGYTLYVPGDVTYDQLYAISTSGNIEWTFDIGDSATVTTQPLVDSQGNIYFSIDDKSDSKSSSTSIGGFYSLNPDGSVRWRHRNQSYYDAFAMGTTGQIYLCSSDTLVAIGYNGIELWRKILDSNQLAPLVIDASNTIYKGGLNFEAISPLDGSVYWSLVVSSSVWHCPSIGEQNQLYFGISGGAQNKYMFAVN